MMLGLLNWQGIGGIAASLTLGLLLIIQKGETSHWRKQSDTFEQLYHSEQAAFSTTVAQYRAVADQARAADEANLNRVAVDQAAINQRTANEFEARLAAARADARRLRLQSEAAADSRARRSASMPGLSAAPGGAAQGTGQNGLPLTDRQIATGQAIQLDELIKWIRQQHAVDPNREPSTP
jgi:hypothetical protein